MPPRAMSSMSNPRSAKRPAAPAKVGGRPAKGALKKKKFLKCFVTDGHKEAIEAYCDARDIPVSHFLYQLVIQIVPNPDT